MFERRNIKQHYIEIKNYLKDFLLSDKSREFFIFLFFFFVAGGFWLLQTLNNDYETEFTVPVRFKGIPENVMITSKPVSEVHVRVKDKGTVLLNYMLSKSFYPIQIDFANNQGKNEVVRIESAVYEKFVKNQLNASTRLLSIKPDTLEYMYSTGASALIPVRLQGSVSTARQYYLSDTIFQPDSVKVYAPEAVLDTLVAAYTQPVNLENLNDTASRTLALIQPKGVRFVPSTVDVVFPVDIYTEKTVEVPITGIGFPAGKELRTFPSKVQVTFLIGLSRFRQVSADDFHIEVSYEELLNLGADKYVVKLKSIPKEVSNVRCLPSQVDFLIEQTSSHHVN